jgi:hypothetical protein
MSSEPVKRSRAERDTRSAAKRYGSIRADRTTRQPVATPDRALVSSDRSQLISRDEIGAAEREASVDGAAQVSPTRRWSRLSSAAAQNVAADSRGQTPRRPPQARRDRGADEGHDRCAVGDCVESSAWMWLGPYQDSRPQL